MAADWDISPGTTLVRRELQARWGGGPFGGMEPSVKAQSVFLFTKPAVGQVFGYVYDGWHGDGMFHYTGDGQVGDQSPETGGNRALLNAERQSRAIRLFRSRGTSTTYLGRFVLDDPPYYRADALDRNKEVRSVLVFRLVPTGEVIRDADDAAANDIAVPGQIPIEATNVESYAAERPDEPPFAVRREAELVMHYASWLSRQGQQTVRHRIPVPGGGYIYTDVFNTATEELIEAKASAARPYVRSGLGQILDYSRYLKHSRRTLLVPEQPSADLVALLHTFKVGVVWRSGQTYHRSDPPP